MLLLGGCKSKGFWISNASNIGQRLLSRENIVKAGKPNRLRREIGLVSARDLPYLSCLEWDISAQLCPSHWEFDSCSFEEWW
jgi:hypothetical protein